jgi:hypothetical protein
MHFLDQILIDCLIAAFLRSETGQGWDEEEEMEDEEVEGVGVVEEEKE